MQFTILWLSIEKDLKINGKIISWLATMQLELCMHTFCRLKQHVLVFIAATSLIEGKDMPTKSLLQDCSRTYTYLES